MIRIVEGLYLGNREAARDLRRLRQEGITHIVNCAVELPNYHEGALTYLALGLHDPDPGFGDHLPSVFQFIDAARQRRGKVLVHCFAAVSRSPSVVLSYLCHLGDPMDVAARKLGDIVWCDPETTFLEQIADHFGHDFDDLVREQLRQALNGWPRS